MRTLNGIPGRTAILAVIVLAVCQPAFSEAKTAVPQPVSNWLKLPDTPEGLEAITLSHDAFVENKGQWEENILFRFDGGGAAVSFDERGFTFQADGEDRDGKSAVPLTARFLGATPVSPTGIDMTQCKHSYYVGADSSKWRKNVPDYRTLKYSGLYEGVDLSISATRKGLKYEFTVAPHASWRPIVMEYDGAEEMTLDASGTLHVKTAFGEVIDCAPVAFQETLAGRVTIPVRFTLPAKTTCAFEVTGSYDPSLPLVIDPEVTWIRWSSQEWMQGLSTEPSGIILSRAADGSVWAASRVHYWPPHFAGFVLVRLDAEGEIISTCTFGESGLIGDRLAPSDIQFDPNGNVLVVAHTNAPNLPTPGGFDHDYTEILGNQDGFVVLLSPEGDLLWASYVGGSSYEKVRAAAFDTEGNLYLTGYTTSDDFVLSPDSFDPLGFLLKVTPDGALAFSTGLPLMGIGYAIGVQPNGNVWVFQNSGCGIPYDILTGNLVTTTFSESGRMLGYKYHEQTIAHMVGQAFWSCTKTDNRGRVWLGGRMEGPSVGPAWLFVARLSPTGEIAEWHDFLLQEGGYAAHHLDLKDFAFDDDDNIFVVGAVGSDQLPNAAWGLDDEPHGGYAPAQGSAERSDCDGFLAKLTPKGDVLWSSYVDGSNNDYAGSVAIDSQGYVWVSGGSESSDFLTNPGPFHPHSSYFVMKILDSGASLLKCLAPADMTVVTAGPPPEFTFSIHPQVKAAAIAFSSSEDFFSKPTKRPSGEIDRTVRFPVKPASGSWTPSAAQWRSIRSVVSSRLTLYWRLEGSAPTYGKTASDSMCLLFDTGSISGLNVAPSHLVDADEAVWPDKDTLPSFTWTDETEGMTWFYIDVSTDPAVPLKVKNTLTLGSGRIAAPPYQVSKIEWKKIRQLATLGSGTLYWRVRAVDSDRLLSCWSEPKMLVMDGGMWNVRTIDFTKAVPYLQWTHEGQGIGKYRLEFSVNDAFAPGAAKTLRVPAKSIADNVYCLKPAEVKKLEKFCERNRLSEVYYRVRGEDAEAAFIAGGPAQTTPAP